MPVTTTQSDVEANGLAAYTWTPQPDAARLVQSVLEECLRDSPFAASFSQRLLDDTGTRLIDWLVVLGLSANHPAAAQLAKVGYQLAGHLGHADWEHPAGMLLSGIGFSLWKTSRFGESALSYFIYGDKP